MSMIQVEHLTKSFASLEVLRDVSLTVEEGECIVIIGGSGCGKSVFLRSLDLLETPDAGRIFIGGDEITARGADVNSIRQKMGMVYQGFHLFEHMDVLDNLTLAPIRLRGASRDEAEQKAVELLKMVSLENRKHAMPGILSGGQKQRIAIARCLAMEPQIMLFDEPTSALDPTMVGEVLATMRMLAKRGMTMIIVTHEMAFAREVGTRILYFDEHGIYEQGTPEEIFDHPQKPKTKAFIRKLKYFSQKIEQRDFDLMQLQGGIQRFAEKYGIGNKLAYRLQLCAEELIYEMLSGAVAEDAAVNLNVNISYSETDKSILLELTCAGREYDPFSVPEDDEAHLGVTILRNVAREISFAWNEGINQIIIKL
jgi:polar amino acid transport system ATP-binding protein